MAFIRKRRSWTSQPQEAVGLNLSHPCAGMVRGYSDVINSSTQPVIVGTRVIVQKTGLMRGYYSTLGAGTTDKLDTGITGTNPDGVSYLLIGSQLSAAAGYGRIFSHNDNHLWTASASQNLSFYLFSGSPYWTVPQLTSVPTVNVITYAGGASDPKMWRDGVAQTVTYESGPRSGAIRDVSQSIYLGNRAAGDRGHDGSIGLFIPFDGVLSDSDAASLSADPCQLLAPRSIWVPVSAGGGGPTPAGTATETDTSLTLSGVQLRAVGQAAETDAAQALVAVQIASIGRADETETALALTPVQITVAGLASETDTALALDAGAASATGIALETDAALALAAVQITATGIATEVDTALALTGLAGTAPGIASETDTAFALAAVQKLVAGAALEVDTALALSAPGGTLDLILRILANRQELNPATGTFTLYDDDGTTVLYTTNAWADAAGTTPYSGGALRRIDALF